MCTCVSYFRLINRKPYERKNIIDNRPIKTLSFQTFLPSRNLDDLHEFPLNIFDDRLLTRRSIHLRVAVHRYSRPRASSLSKPFIPSVYLLLERKPGILKLLERKKTIVAFLRSFGGHERKKWKRIEIYPARILENYRLDFVVSSTMNQLPFSFFEERKGSTTRWKIIFSRFVEIIAISNLHRHSDYSPVELDSELFLRYCLVNRYTV